MPLTIEPIEPERTPEEIEAEELERRQLLRADALDTDTIGQMRGNLERMEREGTTAAPALDRNSSANSGKTQYQIDAAILAAAESGRQARCMANPVVFPVEVAEEL